MRVTNTTRERLTVIVKGEPQNGDAPTDSIESGETKDLNVDPENQSFKGLVFAGALVEERSARRASAKE